MYLDCVESKQIGQEIELSAIIGETRLWYRVPGLFAGRVRAEAFLVSALMPAMARGESLELSTQICISPRLLKSIPKIQEILHAWNPALRKIAVRTNSGAPAPSRPGAACFFSGGVDSAYTYLKHANEITHLVLIHGLDIPPDDEASFSQALVQSRDLAARLGKTLVPVRTNAREFCKANGLTMILFHGALLASVSLLLGFEHNYVPASQTYDDLDPWGSHALLDPLWSTESSEIIYDGGEARRIDKVRAVVEDPRLLASLRVCPGNGGGSNCGKCEKCLLTMTALRLVDATTPAFPKLSMERLRKLAVNFDSLEYYLEMYEVAQQVGDSAVEKSLRSALRRFEVKQILKRTDAVLLGGSMRRLLSAVRGKATAPALLRPDASDKKTPYRS
jgi:hypothetical protein